jgi:hypothetical protein
MMEYVAGELDKAIAEEIRMHIDACDECKKEYELALGMSEAIENAAFDAPAELHGEIMTAIRNEKKRQRRARLIRTLTTIGASAAAFVIIVNVIAGNVTKTKENNSPDQNKQENIVLKSDNVFKPQTSVTSETVELSASTVDRFVGEWKTRLSDGRTVTMYINDDSSVVVCIRYGDGVEVYYDGMLEFTKNGIVLSQSDGNENCRAVIDAVIKSGRLYFDIVSGDTPWGKVT